MSVQLQFQFSLKDLNFTVPSGCESAIYTTTSVKVIIATRAIKAVSEEIVYIRWISSLFFHGQSASK